MHIFQKIKTILVGLLACFCAATAGAQAYLAEVRRFGVEDGLPHREVTSVLEDRQGFLWIGTYGGVARFDGYRFKVFNKNASGLSSDIVVSLMEGHDGKIWIASNDKVKNALAIDILDPITEKVVPAEQYFEGKPFPLKGLHVFSCVQARQNHRPDDDHTLYFSTKDPAALITYHPVTGWKSRPLPFGKATMLHKVTSQNTVFGMASNYSDESVILYEANSKGDILQKFDGYPNHRIVMEPPDTGEPDKMRVFVEGNKTMLWEIERKREETSFTPSPNTYPTFSLLGGEVRIQRHTIVDKEQNVLLNMEAQFPELHAITHSKFLSSSKSNGLCWFYNPFGLYLIDLRQKRFDRYLFDKKFISGKGISCRGIYATENQFWVNTENLNQSLFKIDLKSGAVQSFPGNAAFGLGKDLEGRIWMDAHNKASTVALLDPQTGFFSHMGEKKGFDKTNSFFQDRPDRIWLCGLYGLSLFNPQSGKISYLESAAFPQCQSATFYWMRPDRSGRLWACSTAGLFLLDSNTTVKARYWSGGQDTFHLPFDEIFHFYEDASGIFWIATNGSGLVKWNPQTGEKQAFSRKNGLLNSTVYAVYEDDFGHFWLPTDYGIAQFDKKSGQVRRTWKPIDGIAQFEFNRISHFRSDDGRLFFGGMNGVTAFHPRDFYQKNGNGEEVTYPLVLSGLSFLKKGTGKMTDLTTEISQNGWAEMYPDDQLVQIEFALLDFFNPKGVIYAWKIEDETEEWNYQSEPLLRLSSLPYGKNRIHIRAQSSDGVWTLDGLTINIRYHPPFYLNFWFLLGMSLVFVAAAWQFYRFRTRAQREKAIELQQEVAKQTATIRQQAEKLQQLDEFKSRVYANITHEFRTPLTVILGMTDFVMDDLEKAAQPNPRKLLPDLSLVRRSGEQLLQLVNELLDLSKAQSKELHLQLVQGDTVSYLAFLTDSFAAIAAQRDIELKIERPQVGILMDYDPEKLRQIFSNLLSNALKHTPSGGTVLVKIERENALGVSNLVFEVADTGSGISKEDLPRIFDRFFQSKSTARTGGTGLGLALVQELVKLLGGEVRAESELGIGSLFRVKLPIHNNAEPEHATTSAGQTTNMPGEAEQPASHTAPEKNYDHLPQLLVVEDNPDVVRYLQICLRDEYQLQFAPNGRIGIEQALATLPDLIVSDLMMPEVDGLELCETLKSDERSSHIPIVLLTARADLESRLAGLRRGADAYLAKPFDRKELPLVLQNLLAFRKKLHEYYQKMMLPGNLPGASDTSEQKHFVPNPDDFFMEKIVRFLESNLDNSALGLDDICQKAGMSRRHLNRKMTALTGLAPMQYLRQMRLERAKILLASPGPTIAEIAYATGFEDPKYFSRAFSEAYGMAPSEFRSR